MVIANQFLDRLQTGYQTANLPLIVSLYNDPVVMADVTRDLNQFYTAESMKAELEMAFERRIPAEIQRGHSAK